MSTIQKELDNITIIDLNFLEKLKLRKQKQEVLEPQTLDVTLPNGLMLIVIRTIDKYNIVNIVDIEEKLKLMERVGVPTYEFGVFVDGKLKDASFDILRDLLIYHSIGWLEVNKENTACIFTQKGRCMAERMKVHRSLHDKFYSVF